MAVKLHRCPSMWLKLEVHPCWRVQKALDEAGIEYELAPGPLSRAGRKDLARLSAQWLYPVIEFEDGSVYHEQSKAMAATIRTGKLFEKKGSSENAGRDREGAAPRPAG